MYYANIAIMLEDVVRGVELIKAEELINDDIKLIMSTLNDIALLKNSK